MCKQQQQQQTQQETQQQTQQQTAAEAAEAAVSRRMVVVGVAQKITGSNRDCLSLAGAHIECTAAERC